MAYAYKKVIPDISGLYAIGQNLVVNINGTQISGYKFGNEITSDGNTYRELQYNATSQTVTDVDDIKEYLLFMTGVDFLPLYDANRPYLISIILTGTNAVWKYQYDQDTGLRVYRVDNFPLAFKSAIPQFSLSGTTLTITLP